MAPQKYKKQQYQGGIASLPIIISLIVIILVVIIGSSVAVFNDLFVAAGGLNASNATFYAEAGARDALMRVIRSKTYSCTAPALPTGCYSVDMVSNGCSTNEGCARITVSAGVGSAGDPKIINCEGRVKNSVKKIKASVIFDASSNGEISSVTWQEI
jgi:hypothetical protein